MADIYMHQNQTTRLYQVWLCKQTGWVNITDSYFRQEGIPHPVYPKCVLVMRSPGNKDYDPSWILAKSLDDKEKVDLEDELGFTGQVEYST